MSDNTNLAGADFTDMCDVCFRRQRDDCQRKSGCPQGTGKNPSKHGPTDGRNVRGITPMRRNSSIPT